jgi:hypothetical protein
LAKFLINSDLDSLLTTNHCTRYLYDTRFLVIRFSSSEGEELITTIEDDEQDDVERKNENERRKNVERDIFETSDEKRVFEMTNKQHVVSKHVFQATVNAFFANENDRRSIESYTFKLFDDLID